MDGGNRGNVDNYVVKSLDIDGQTVKNGLSIITLSNSVTWTDDEKT